MVIRHRGVRRDAGYNLVMLVVLIAVMQILLAAALPKVSQQAQREKEAELIFRGLQYAEAIRVFQLRFGRLPVSLDELIEVQPRTIRKLWKDPMTDDGEWELLLASAASGGQPGQPGRPGQSVTGISTGQLGGGLQDSGRNIGGGFDDDDSEDEAEEDPGNRRRGRRGRSRGFGDPPKATGPIVGVHSSSSEESIRTFFGGSKYSDWRFTPDLLPVSPGPVGDNNVTRLHTLWLGQSFPQGIEVPEQGAPALEQGGLPGTDTRGRRGQSNRNQRRDRGGRSRSDG